MHDFYDEDELRRVYYAEAERLIAEATGASKVFVFDHTVRRRVQGVDDRAPGAPRQPATSVHVGLPEALENVGQSIGVDADSGLVHTVTTTPANVADIQEAECLLHGKEQVVYADAGYSTHCRRAALQARGIRAAIVYRKHKHDGHVCRVMRAYNSLVNRTRARVETVFAILKQHMKWRRCRS